MCKPDKKMLQDFIKLWKSCLDRFLKDATSVAKCCQMLDEEIGNLVDDLIRECFSGQEITKRFIRDCRHQFIKTIVLSQDHFKSCLDARRNPLAYLRYQGRVYFNPDYFSGN